VAFNIHSDEALQSNTLYIKGKVFGLVFRAEGWVSFWFLPVTDCLCDITAITSANYLCFKNLYLFTNLSMFLAEN
jgi:hypothetical protein